MASGVAIIRVGAATEVEMIEKKHRIDDALEAVRSAQEEGVIPGGGTALLYLAKRLNVATETPEQAIGASIVLESVEGPLRQMSVNAGLSPDIVVNTVKNECTLGNGFDFMSGEVCSLVDKGIIDPSKVTRCAVENAVSVASTLLITGYAIVSQ